MRAFTKRNIIIGIIVLALVGGFFYYRSRSTGEPVQTETVKKGDVSEMISVSGELVPTTYADLAFSGTGVISSIAVKEGNSVRAGQAIATLDSPVLESQLNEARIAQAIAEESEKLARHGWDDLKQEERNAKKLASEQARENVRTVIAQIGDRTITAPFEGMVSKLDAREGEVATLGQTIARVAQAGDFVIEARVPESDIIKVSLGMQAEITFDAFRSDEIFDAVVTEIDPASTVVQDVVSYVVKFRLENIDARLKDGMTANIDIETAKRENVLTVPFRSLVKEGDTTYAEVRQDDGTFVRTAVTTGLEGDDGTIEITSGLKEGDVITTLSTQKQ
ncbi:MAG: hypothetical protein A3E38_02320 [Candidatus Moranbacteria bacterium RIFCSPHIGHO2_12_FULL_54_9]|nr:MAG: hypothetical protein A2878_02805 [Candidatus Moranbacteria bacterium RIFCSPHIGHO2_01_FULL_54_31]OGI26065.1 MAG: hypothetical protein A3E38_02320 [Candidatus Moranbacteria bacterium RIFCSPHIGHO2_12_FULL_54_9]